MADAYDPLASNPNASRRPLLEPGAVDDAEAAVDAAEAWAAVLGIRLVVAAVRHVADMH